MLNPDFAFGFESLNQEVCLEDLPIKGAFPRWLEGRLVRTGPAVYEAGKQFLKHWFDGHAMLHAFSFKDGKVDYRNRTLKSKTYAEAQRKHRLTIGQFGTDPCYSIFGRIMSFFDNARTDNCNVNVMEFGGQSVAMTETPSQLIFDPETLETGPRWEFSDKLFGHVHTAHPHFDTTSGTLFNCFTRFGYKSKYQFYSQEWGSPERKPIAIVETKKPCYLHSFGCSENYLILAEFPLTVLPLKLKFRFKPFIQNYKWEPGKKLRFTVISRKTGEIVASGFSDPFFGFHHINAFEKAGKLFVDISVLENADVIDYLYLNSLREANFGRIAGFMKRFEIKLGEKEQKVFYQQISEADIELPRINYARNNGKEYTYVWGVSSDSKGFFINSLVKINTVTGSFSRWNREGSYPGEPVFVQRPGCTDEDGGVLLSIVLNASTRNSSLCVFDAADLSLLAEAILPHHVPFGFHGQYFKR